MDFNKQLKILSYAFYISLAVTMILLVAAFFIINGDTRKQESYIGEKVVLEGDTLTIIDFSMWAETFTLSDGKRVHRELILN